MAYDETLSARVREVLGRLQKVEEKLMFGGVCYMLNGKMCVGVVGNELMCRIGPHVYDEALERTGCREMVFTGKPMKGYVFVDESGFKNRRDFSYWMDLCVAFNKEAKASKKKKAKKS